MANEAKILQNWIGYIINIPEQHRLVITGKWKDRPDIWWWKCKNCKESAGSMSTKQLEKLEAKGMISEPDGEKLPHEYSGHPSETGHYYDDEYGYWPM